MSFRRNPRFGRAASAVFAIVAAAPAIAAAAPARTPARPIPALSTDGIALALASAPLSFDRAGGSDSGLLARGAGIAVAVGPASAAVALGSASATAVVARIDFAGGSRAARPIGGGPRARLDGVYPGVDAVFYGARLRPEYDVVVRPGASTASVRIAFGPSARVSLAEDGALLVDEVGGTIRHEPPVAYQEVECGRRRVACRYVLRGEEAGFAVGAYDPTLPLVVDPVLSFATYLGGRASVDDVRGVAVDKTGAVYVTGSTASPDFPVLDGARPTGGSTDAYVAKFAPDGRLVYARILGGPRDDAGSAIAVDADGSVFVAGIAGENFPTLGGLGTRSAGPTDAFVASLDATGAARFVTLVGGTDVDRAYGLALDDVGRPVVVGETQSADFPLVGVSEDPEPAGASTNAFVARLSADGATLELARAMGGSSGDAAYSVAADPAGSLYLVGYTASGDFPTTVGAFEERNPNGGDGGLNGFVVKLGPDDRVTFATYFGGSAEDVVAGVAADATGATVAGWTASPDFPTVDAIQAKPGGGRSDGFVAKLAPSGSALVYSTYLGGDGADLLFGVALGSNGRPALAGTTDATDFPGVGAVEGVVGDLDRSFGLAAVLEHDGTSLVFSTLYGGTDGGATTCVAVGPAGEVVAGGVTDSSDLVLRDEAFGFPGDAAGLSNGFVARFASVDAGPIPPAVDRVRFRRGGPKSARVLVDGRNFGPSMRVYVDDRPDPWPDVRRDGATRVVLDRADDLAAAFPRGSRMRLRCVDDDGGEFTTFVKVK